MLSRRIAGSPQDVTPEQDLGQHLGQEESVTLRRRLTLVLGVLVFLPLAAGGLFIAWSVPRAADQRTDTSLQSAQASVVAALVSRCERAGIAASSLGRDLATSTPKQATLGVVTDRLADYAAVTDANGVVLGSYGAPVFEAVAMHHDNLEPARCKVDQGVPLA